MVRSRQRAHTSSTGGGESQMKRHAKGLHDHSRRRTADLFNSKDEATEDEDLSPILPGFTPFVVVVVTLAIRVCYVMDPRNWWMVHPDEVYHSVEVAHIETYGYGFRTFDFSPLERHDDVTRYRQMELKADMYALRSPIFPYFYVLVSWLVSWTGLQMNPYLLWRVAHVIVTSLLPLAVFRYVRNLYNSRDTGSVAAILVASSVHLNVLGTHCFIQSFLSPFTFFALSLLSDLKVHGRNLCLETDSNEGEGHHGTLEADTFNTNNGCIPKGRTHTHMNNGDIEYHLWTFGDTGVLSQRLGKALPVNGKVENNGHVRHSPAERIALKFRHRGKGEQCYTLVAAFVAGVIIGITSYIQPDLILVFTANIFLVEGLCGKVFTATFDTCVLGTASAVFVAVLSDFRYYGWGLVTPINWVKFHVVKGLSSTLFGQMSAWKYVEDIFFYDLSIFSLALSSLAIHFYLFLRKRYNTYSRSHESAGSKYTGSRDPGLHFKSLAVVYVLLLIYSITGHKETRFIHDVIVLIFIYIADVLVQTKSLFTSITVHNNAIRFILGAFLLTQYQNFPDSIHNTQWVFQKTENVQDMNACIKYVASGNDVTGVFYDSNVFLTGGMSLLHHDVMVMTLMTGGFYEFGPSSRKMYNGDGTLVPSGFLQEKQHNQKPFHYIFKSVNEFTKASNYVAQSNAQAAISLVLQNPSYNYLIVKRDRKFVDAGFIEVFSTASRRVLRRLLDEESEFVLKGMVEKLPMGTNATVVLHEGDVLFHMDQFMEASKRFRLAISLDEKMVDAFLPLQLCFQKMGDHLEATRVLRQCQSLFSKEACTTPRRITRL